MAEGQWAAEVEAASEDGQVCAADVAAIAARQLSESLSFTQADRRASVWTNQTGTRLQAILIARSAERLGRMESAVHGAQHVETGGSNRQIGSAGLGKSLLKAGMNACGYKNRQSALTTFRPF